LQSLVAISNLLGGFVDALLIPMILLYTGQDTTITGLLVSVMGIGALIGGIFVSIHGGPKKLIFGVLGGLLPILLGQILLGIGSETTVWIIGALLLTLFHPMVSSSLQTIWQLSVDKNLQGKVFGARRLISGIAGPFGMLIASSLADNVFEPAMQGENFLSNSFKWLVDDVPGSGMSILLIISGLIGALIIIWGFTSKKLKTLNKKLETKMKSEKDAAPVSG
jgi:DHA3 family macrolide efflux protein-like MFS transporter